MTGLFNKTISPKLFLSKINKRGNKKDDIRAFSFIIINYHINNYYKL